MTNLKLITTETFGELPCNFYRNMNDDILLTREQIGQALEYADPIKAIQNIHSKHKNRLDNLCIHIKSETFDIPQSDGGRKNNLMTERVYYSERGIMEICRWSRQPKANLFMDWVWDIIEKYRHNELQPDLKPLIDALSSITQTLTTLANNMVNMQKEIDSLKQPTPNQSQNKKYSYWYSKMYPKYLLIMEYFNITECKELYKQLYWELQNTYPDIELNQLVDDYCYENHLNTCYTLDAIEHDKTTRKLFENVVDNILERYNLTPKINTVRYKTIFDDDTTENITKAS